MLDKHASQPFNPDVANVFFRAGLIESWGRGIERIMQACADEGVSAPEVSSDVNELWMTFRFLPEHQHVSAEREGSTTHKKGWVKTVNAFWMLCVRNQRYLSALWHKIWR